MVEDKAEKRWKILEGTVNGSPGLLDDAGVHPVRPHYSHMACLSCSSGSSLIASSRFVLHSCVRISLRPLCSTSLSAAKTGNWLSTSALAPMLITLSALNTDLMAPSQHGLICASWPPRASVIALESLLTLLRTLFCGLGHAKLLFGYYPLAELCFKDAVRFSLDSAHWRPCRFMQQCRLVQMIQPWRVNFDNFRRPLFRLQIQNAAVN